MKFTTDKILALVDIDRDSEYSGDDVDRVSKLVDLGGPYRFIQVFIPALSASAVVDLLIQADGAIATVPSNLISLVTTQAGHYVPSTSSGAGSISVVFDTGAAQYLRVRCSADQSADRNFYVRGIS